MVAAVLDEDNDEAIYQPAVRIFQYERKNAVGKQWFYEDFDLSVQDIEFLVDPNNPSSDPHFVLLGSEGDVVHLAKPERYQEWIEGAGTTHSKAKFYGKVLRIKRIGEKFYAVGTGGQIYIKEGPNHWRLLSDSVLFDPSAEEKRQTEPEPPFLSPEWMEWTTRMALNPASRNIVFHDIAGISENCIYICGEEGPGTKPVLCFWDGSILHEIKIHPVEASLTGIYIENPESVWICGREGLLLHGSYGRGFTPVNIRQQLNLFHSITPYRGKLVMPASVRPGGLYEYDPITGEFGRFQPRLPQVRRLESNPEFALGGPFFVQAVGDVLWVVAAKDVFRFDGKEWERIEHPDV